MDLQRENTSLGQKWQDAKALHEEAVQDLEHRDSQLERTLGGWMDRLMAYCWWHGCANTK